MQFTTAVFQVPTMSSKYFDIPSRLSEKMLVNPRNPDFGCVRARFWFEKRFSGEKSGFLEFSDKLLAIKTNHKDDARSFSVQQFVMATIGSSFRTLKKFGFVQPLWVPPVWWWSRNNQREIVHEAL